MTSGTSKALSVVRLPGFIVPVFATTLIYILEAATLASALKATGIELSTFQNFVVLGAVGVETTNAFVAATAYQIFPLMLIVTCGPSIIAFQVVRPIAVRAVQ